MEHRKRTRWGRSPRSLTMAETQDIERRYLAGEKVNDIAERYGLSGGSVSNLCKALGCPARTNKSTKAERMAKAAAMAGGDEHPPRGELAFVFEGVPVYGEADFMSLTDLWRAAGSPPNKRPAEWLRGEGREFVEHVSGMVGTHTALVSTEAGGRENGATWGYWEIALGYATDLNPALRRYVYQVFRHFIEGRLHADTPETEAEIDASLKDAGPAAGEMLAMFAALNAEIKGLRGEIVELRGKYPTIDEIQIAVDETVAKLRTAQRKRPTKLVQEAARWVIKTYYGSKCPACRTAVILNNEGGVLPGVELDHHQDDATKTNVDTVWLLCKACHNGFTAGTLYRTDYKHAAAEHVRLIRQCEKLDKSRKDSRQATLGLDLHEQRNPNPRPGRR